MDNIPRNETCPNMVYSDLGLPSADKLQFKYGLVVKITRAVRKLALPRKRPRVAWGITQPKVSGMMHGDFTNLSERKLIDCLNRLGYDIEIRVKPAAELLGHLMLAVA